MPLLVAYEEEVKELRQSKVEMEEIIEKNKERLGELLEDNTEMASQLRDIAVTGPVDWEEFRVLRESAALVLEENSLLRETSEATAARLERLQEEAQVRLVEQEEQLAELRLTNTRLTARNKKLQEEVTTMQQAEDNLQDQRMKLIPLEKHNSAVQECQQAFDELKKSYKQETDEKTDKLEKLGRESAELRDSLERALAAGTEMELELRLTTKMVRKYESLSQSLQDKLLEQTKERAEAEETARRCEEEAEAAKLETSVLARLARQQRAAGRQAERERGEETEALARLQRRICQLKESMGGRIAQLQVE